MTRHRLPGTVGMLLVVASVLVGVLFGALYLFPDLQTTNRGLAMLSSFLPYGVAAWALAVIVAFATTRGRGRWLVALLIAGLLAHATMLAGYLAPGHLAPHGTTPTLRLMSLNMHYGQADLGQLYTEVRLIRPDVLVLTEFTQPDLTELSTARWQELLPYSLGSTGRGSPSPRWGDPDGTHVYSRTPLAGPISSDETMSTFPVTMTVTGQAFTLVAAHPRNMLRGGVDGWVSDAEALTHLVQGLRGPVVVAGDLNAVPEHITVRNLLAGTGLHEALTGWQPTYPADRLVPLIRIDHVLASEEFRTVSTSTFHVDGTDHLGVIAELVTG